jgi:hypothetical protein
MSSARCCKCGPGATKLWTLRRAWTESARLPNGAQRFGWRCEGCRGAHCRFVGSLWHDTFVGAGGVPACELGCIGAAPHLAGTGRCPRVPPKCGIVVDMPVGPPIRLSLLGPDFVRVHNAHPTHLALVRIVIRDKGGMLPFPFPIEVCIMPGLPLEVVIPCGHRTRVTHRGVVGLAGDIPWSFYVVRATVADAVPVKNGIPSRTFLGLAPQTWSRIRNSECAWRRYAPLFYGHTAAVRLASGETWPIHPLVNTTVRPQLPASSVEGGGFKCGYCQRVWPTAREYMQTCAPDTVMGHISNNVAIHKE